MRHLQGVGIERGQRWEFHGQRLSTSRLTRNRSLRDIVAMDTKKCSRCGIEKLLRMFSKNAGTYLGVRPHCKSCESFTKRNPGQFKSKRSSPVKVSEDICLTPRQQYNLRRRYGVTPEWYVETYRKQNGRCSICGNPETSVMHGYPTILVVDHCAKTGKVRGLLCRQCNTRLSFVENPKWMESAMRYLGIEK